MNVKKKFKKLISKETVDRIVKSNWVEFEDNTECVGYNKEITINFLETDGKGDTVIHLSFNYDLDNEIFYSGNCIDHPEIEFSTYDEMIQHLIDIESQIIDNGFKFINL